MTDTAKNPLSIDLGIALGEQSLVSEDFTPVLKVYTSKDVDLKAPPSKRHKPQLIRVESLFQV